MKNIFVISLALYQTKFWHKVITDLNIKNYKIKIVIFDTESKNYLKNKNSIFVDISNVTKNNKFSSISDIKKKLKEKKIKNINYILKHEKVFYGKRNNYKILSNYLDIQEFLENHEEFNSPNNLFIQEIGGFAPNLCIYEFCKRKKINHYFLETSFFLNHVHFIKNHTKCIPIKNNLTDEKFELNPYLNNLKENNLISIPLKDTRHFKLPLKKLFDLHNFKRFVQKVSKKYFLNFKYVFGEDILILLNNLKCILNYNIIKKHYSKNIRHEYVYFPLHVPNDFAITFRSSNYYDQLNFVDKLCKLIYPKTIFIKEHPARVGSFEAKKVKELLTQNKNLRIIDPRINNFEIIKNCQYLVSINSKAGYEAILLGKHVITFGESFYKNSNLIKYCQNLSELKNSHNYLEKKISNQEIMDFFSNIKQQCFKGALYDMNPINVKNFSNSIKQILNND